MLVYASPDGRFQVALPGHVHEGMLAQARQAAWLETGGIVIGRYSADHRTAVVSRAELPPADSSAGRTWFYRGTLGLRAMLQRLWAGPQRSYYLGEWHYHPHAAAAMSPTDLTTMQRSTLQDDFACWEPLLLILGGDPDARHHLHVYVFPDQHTAIQLELKVTG